MKQCRGETEQYNRSGDNGTMDRGSGSGTHFLLKPRNTFASLTLLSTPKFQILSDAIQIPLKSLVGSKFNSKFPKLNSHSDPYLGNVLL